MRIISGTHKGRRFQVGASFKARPTTDFAKETLFNVLQNMYDFEGLEVLDLFAGTGSISYEFASRGALVTAIEKNNRHYEGIRKNRDLLGFDDVISMIRADVFKYLPKFKRQFDIVFADPPFALKELQTLPKLVFDLAILAEGAIFILEHGVDYDFSEELYFKRLVKRGSVHFSFFEKK